MHLHNVLRVAENSHMEWFHNIITDVFQVVLVEALVLPQHALPQLKPKPIIKVDTFIKSQVGTPVISKTFFIQSIPEVVHRYLLQRAEGPLIYHKLLRRLLTFYQKRLVLFKLISSEYEMC